MRFVAESIIHASPERVFAFHELPDALARLTPPWEHMHIVQHAPSLHPGARTILEVRIAPFVWMRSEALHIVYEPPHLFVDEQVRGPFRKWHHRHEMHAIEEGTRLRDVIDYELPFGVPRFLIERRLRRVFAWRHEVTEQFTNARAISAQSSPASDR